MGAAILEQQEQLAYKESFPTTGGSIVVDSLLIVVPLWNSVTALCFVVRYFVSNTSYAIILIGERAGCFALYVLLGPHDCCSALLRGATGLFTVCDCDIS